jgi:hypothetical protein
MTAGFGNSIVYAHNVDFTGNAVVTGQITTNGQLLIGNSSFPNIRAGTITSTGGSITISYSAPNINLEVAGGSGIQTIDGDTGSITGSTVTIYTNNAGGPTCGSSVLFVNSGTVSTLNVTDAVQNTMIGLLSGNGSISGSHNTGIGYAGFQILSSGTNNAGFGGNNFTTLTSGNNNTACGQAAGTATTGSSNTACGQAAGTGTSGSGNVSIGQEALLTLTSGSNNTAVGTLAGFSYTGSESNNILIGYNERGTVGESNVIRIGTAASITKTFIGGIASVSVSNTQMVTINTSTGQMGSQAIPSASITWVAASSTPITAAVNTGYYITDASQVTITLPAVAAAGSIVAIAGNGAGGWILQPGSGQTIKVINVSAGTSITSAEQYDCIEVICVVANTTWVARNFVTTGFTYV